jgi:phenylpyruvate tautomerase PptA (4-oxalocrotonate tautomerase family)
MPFYQCITLVGTLAQEQKEEIVRDITRIHRETITMGLVEMRRGRSLDLRLELGRRIVDICAEVLGVPKRTVLVEFTAHSGDEILRDGEWAGEWTAAEASSLPSDNDQRS